MTTANRKAFLDMIAHSELGPALLAASDNGYNVIVGSTPSRPILFRDYADHPRKLITITDKHGKPVLDKRGNQLKSTAAGRYQLLSKYFEPYKRLLNLRDFSPESQDAIAIQQIREQGALADVDAGRFARAVEKCRNIWASFPGAGYGQHENKLAVLEQAYVKAGGVLA